MNPRFRKTLARSDSRLIWQGMLLLACFLVGANGLSAEVLDLVPRVKTASAGLQMIQKDSFGPIELQQLLESKDSIDAENRAFEPEMGRGYHGVSVSENFGRVEFWYQVDIDDDHPTSEHLFDLDKEAIIEHMETLGVGSFQGNRSLNDTLREYKWQWTSGEFSCEVLYSYWEETEPFLQFHCASRN